MLKTLTVVEHQLLVFALGISLNLPGVSILPVLIHSRQLQQTVVYPILYMTYNCQNTVKEINIPNSFQKAFSVHTVKIGKTLLDIQLKQPVSENTKYTLFLKH